MFLSINCSGTTGYPYKKVTSWVPLAYTYNPSYSGGSYQEDHGSKPAQANTSQDSSQKNSSQKRADEVAQGLGPKFKFSTAKKGN
jgi:hypothetical protein